MKKDDKKKKKVIPFVFNFENEVVQIDEGNYVIDTKDNKVWLKNKDKLIEDAFTKSFGDVLKIVCEKDEETGDVAFIFVPKNPKEEAITLVLDREGHIVEYHNPNVKKLGKGFLEDNDTLKVFECKSVEEIGDNFLRGNKTALEELDMPRIKKLGNNALENNESLECDLGELELPVEEMGNACFKSNTKFMSVRLGSLKKCGNDCFVNCNAREVVIGNLHDRNIEIGDNFFQNNKDAENITIYASKIGAYCFEKNKQAFNVKLPSLKYAQIGLLYNAEKIERIDVPKLERIDCNCFGGEDFAANYLAREQIAENTSKNKK